MSRRGDPAMRTKEVRRPRRILRQDSKYRSPRHEKPNIPHGLPKVDRTASRQQGLEARPGAFSRDPVRYHMTSSADWREDMRVAVRARIPVFLTRFSLPEVRFPGREIEVEKSGIPPIGSWSVGASTYGSRLPHPALQHRTRDTVGRRLDLMLTRIDRATSD